MLTTGSLISLFTSIVLPHLQYCLMVGGFGGLRKHNNGCSSSESQEAICGPHGWQVWALPKVLNVGDLYRQQVARGLGSHAARG